MAQDSLQNAETADDQSTNDAGPVDQNDIDDLLAAATDSMAELDNELGGDDAGTSSDTGEVELSQEQEDSTAAVNELLDQVGEQAEVLADEVLADEQPAAEPATESAEGPLDDVLASLADQVDQLNGEDPQSVESVENPAAASGTVEQDDVDDLLASLASEVDQLNNEDETPQDAAGETAEAAAEPVMEQAAEEETVSAEDIDEMLSAVSAETEAVAEETPETEAVADDAQQAESNVDDFLANLDEQMDEATSALNETESSEAPAEGALDQTDIDGALSELASETETLDESAATEAEGTSDVAEDTAAVDDTAEQVDEEIFAEATAAEADAAAEKDAAETAENVDDVLAALAGEIAEEEGVAGGDDEPSATFSEATEDSAVEAEDVESAEMEMTDAAAEEPVDTADSDDDEDVDADFVAVDAEAAAAEMAGETDEPAAEPLEEPAAEAVVEAVAEEPSAETDDEEAAFAAATQKKQEAAAFDQQRPNPDDFADAEQVLSEELSAVEEGRQAPQAVSPDAEQPQQAPAGPYAHFPAPQRFVISIFDAANRPLENVAEPVKGTLGVIAVITMMMSMLAAAVFLLMQ